MSEILITGAAGFIGSHLAAACIAAGHRVHAVVRPMSSEDRLRPIGPALVRHHLDLRSEEDLRRCIRDILPEIVFHLAGQPRSRETPHLDDAIYQIDELQCLVRLLRTLGGASRPPRVFVRGGTLAEYGAAPAPYREDQREQPLTTYGACMLAATHLTATLQPRLPFPIATARLALVYGPKQSPEYLIPLLIQRCLDGLPSTVRRPDDRRDLIYVDDAVAGLMRLAEADLSGALVVNLASGVAPPMHEVARLVTEATGSDPGLVELASDEPPNGASLLLGSTERAQALLGWSARTPLAEGIRATIAQLRVSREPDAPRDTERQPDHADGVP